MKTVPVSSGAWRTIETGWNIHFFVRFRNPRGAQVKVRYGVGWLGWDSQRQTLTGNSPTLLEVGGASITFARVQIKVEQTSDITYTYIAG